MMEQHMINVIGFISFMLLIYFSVLWVSYLFLLLATYRTIIKKFKESSGNSIMASLDEQPFLPITIMVPAFNEAKRIVNTIASILNLDYKNVQIIIVNDGSSDTTLATLIETYALIEVPPAFKTITETGHIRGYYVSSHLPQLTVIDKQHSPYEDCAADCLNAALNACKTPLYVTVDADTTLEKEALTRLLFSFLINPHCVAVGGTIYVPDTAQMSNGQMLKTNIPTNLVLGVQACEYLRSFLYGREGWSLMGGALCHPGAFTLLETQAVVDAMGYDAANFSYDAEIIMKLHHVMRDKKFPYCIAYSSSAIAWSEEPQTLKTLWQQRSRWQRGLLRCLSRHKSMMLNPYYGVTGLIAFPFYVLFEIFGPVIEAISYLICALVVCLQLITWVNLAWLILLAWSYMLLITLSCTVLSLVTYNKYHTRWDILHIVGLTLVDMCFYRQWRAFCALFASLGYVANRIRG